MKSVIEPQINLFKKSNPYKAKVLENIRLTPDPGSGKRPKKEGIAAIHKISLSIDPSIFPFIAGQSAGVVVPGEDPLKISKGSENTGYSVRLYSIASPSHFAGISDNTMDLIVKRDNSYDEDGNIIFNGVCSNYLCSLKSGDEVMLTGPSGKNFLLPSDSFSGDIYLCATGTGIAPFYGMIRELLKSNLIEFTGNLTLLYGAAYSDEIILRDELEILQKEHSNFKFLTAISREEKNPYDGNRMYINHLIRGLDQTIRISLENECRFYICGGPKGMEKSVIGEIQKIAGFSGDMKDFEESLKVKNQLFVETY